MGLWDITTYLMLNLSFCVSPIDSRRFNRELRYKIQDKNERLSHTHIEHKIDERRKYDHIPWGLMLQPRKLANAIKRYHMCDNTFFIYLFGHLLLLFYMLIKCILHAMITGSDDQLADYIERTYYFPRLFESYDNTHMFYNVTISVCFSSLLIRLASLHRLIKYSLINVNTYKRFNIVQNNLAYLMFPNWNLTDWLKIYRYALRHEFQRRTDPYVHYKHTRFDEHVAERISNFNHAGLIYHTNIISFNDCYEKFEHFYDPKQRNTRYRYWHYSTPVHLFDPFEWALNTIGYLTFSSTAFLLVTSVNICIYYYELLCIVPKEHYDPLDVLSMASYVSTYLNQPSRLIRLADLIFFAIIQLLTQIDATMYLWDTGIMFSRTRKLICCFESDLRLCLRTNVYLNNRTERYQFRPHQFKSNYSYQLMPSIGQISPIYENGYQQSAIYKKNILELNERLRYMCKLARLLRDEFLDVKSWHSNYVNILIVSNGFCLAYCVSLLTQIETLSSLFCIFVCAISSTAPLCLSIIYSLSMDWAVSDRIDTFERLKFQITQN